jgi:hypothetical protein
MWEMAPRGRILKNNNLGSLVTSGTDAPKSVVSGHVFGQSTSINDVVFQELNYVTEYVAMRAIPVPHASADSSTS